MGAAMTFFFANRPLTGVTITFIRCLNRVTGVSIGQGEYATQFMPFRPLIFTIDVDGHLRTLFGDFCFDA